MYLQPFRKDGENFHKQIRKWPNLLHSAPKSYFPLTVTELSTCGIISCLTCTFPPSVKTSTWEEFDECPCFNSVQHWETGTAQLWSGKAFPGFLMQAQLQWFKRHKSCWLTIAEILSEYLHLHSPCWRNNLKAILIWNRIQDTWEST